MIKILISGIFGHMGRNVAELVEADKDCSLLCGVDLRAGEMNGAPVYASFADVKEKADAVIDFSHPDNLEWVCAYVRARHCVLICGTTGLNDAQKQLLQQTAQACPVFYSANFSYGIAMLERMLEMLTPLLKEDFDMEVVEAHHGQKQDAPSGTAAMLVEAMDPHHEFKRVYGREGFVGKRGKEIGIHAIRGGTVAGEHTVLYLGQDESLKITHTASSQNCHICDSHIANIAMPR